MIHRLVEQQLFEALSVWAGEGLAAAP